MLAAVFQGPGQMEVTEVDTHDIGPDEVLVKVGANGKTLALPSNKALRECPKPLGTIRVQRI
jgi:hypothetical protein